MKTVDYLYNVQIIPLMSYKLYQVLTVCHPMFQIVSHTANVYAHNKNHINTDKHTTYTHTHTYIAHKHIYMHTNMHMHIYTYIHTYTCT